MLNNCFPDPKLYLLQISAILNKNKSVHIYIYIYIYINNDCSNPPSRSFYLKFRHNVSKAHKKEDRDFGDSRWKGSRAMAANLMEGTKPPPPPPLPVGNRFNVRFCFV